MDIQLLALISGIGISLVVTPVLAVLLYVTRRDIRELQRAVGADRPRLPSMDRPPVDGDDEHLRHSIDAIALELERVSEGQRFVTKLLADRRRTTTPVPNGSDSGRTPH